MPHEQPGRDEWPRPRPQLPSWEDLRTSLWFWPAVAAFVGFVVAVVLGNVHPTAGSPLASWAWPGDHHSAIAFLQVVAGSVITVTSLTFSLVVVALQLASQQFSPRLLREFTRDLITQVVLAVFVTTFVVAVTVLREVDGGQPLPRLGLALTFVLVLLSISALLGFLGHIARLVRVDTMMAAVHRETRQVIERQYPPYGDEDRGPDLPPEAEHADTVVYATKSGFLQEVDVARLVAFADTCDAVVVLGVRPGDQITMGSPLARVLVAGERRAEMDAAVHAAIELGYERTLQQDAALGLRQLTDIAVKALSPGINDPTTAGHAIGHASDLLIRLQRRRLGPVVHPGGNGAPRVETPDRDIRYYLDLVVAPVRRYGAREPTVLLALMRMLRDVAVAARDEEQRQEIARQAGLVLSTVRDDLLAEDTEAVRDGAHRVHEVLRGNVLGAYADRAGETRSL